MLKKAHEILVLYDAEIALFVFSTKGKLFEYSSGSCIERILKRNEKYSYVERFACKVTDYRERMNERE